MAKSEMSTQQKQEYAKLLYLTNRDLSQKELAERVGVNPKTIRDWIDKGNWEALRQSAVVSKQDQIKRLYIVLNAVAAQIEKSEGGVGTPAMADMMIKYSAALRNLETDTGAQESVDVCMQLITYTQKNYPDFYKTLTEIADGFIMEKLK